jgi:hypothetical protein
MVRLSVHTAIRIEGDGANQIAFDDDFIVTGGASYRPLSRPGRTHVVVKLSLANIFQR